MVEGIHLAKHVARMEKELDSDIIKSTQTALGKYVKRPPLSEKLLKKPPFRFLHDIITTVLKTTGFFENLFEDQELISDNVKDRERKILFLTKVIYVISTTTGKSLSVKPSKIISGQEPEKTNELLQCLAQALDDKLSSDKAVNQYKESLNSTQINEPKSKEITKPLKKGTDVKKLTSRSNEKLTSQKASKLEKEKSSDVKVKRKENGSTKSDVQNKKSEQSKVTVKRNTKELRNDDDEKRIKTGTPKIAEKEKTSTKIGTENTATLRKVSSQDTEVSLENEESPEKISHVNNVDPPVTKSDSQGQLNTSYTINDNDLNSSASSSDILGIPNNDAIENNPYGNNYGTETLLVETRQPSLDDNKDIKLKTLQIASDVSVELKETSLNDNIEREQKIIDKEKLDSFNSVKELSTSANNNNIPRPQSVRTSNIRPSSSRPGAPRMREKVDNIIKDPDNLLMGKVNIIVENTPQEEEDDSSLIILDQAEATTPSQDQQELQLSSTEHGHLVQQILESQKGLSQISGKTEIEWQFGAQKAREAANQEIEQLRYSIQALSRVANPLGKLLDHIQEDVEVMRQELQQWSNIYEEVNKDMLQQKTLNEDSLISFHTKLKQLDGDIHEKHDKINDLKILIHKNANKIEKLLNSGNVQY